MPVRAVVFDIGGVLEDAPPIGVAEGWEAALGLRPGELNERLGGVWEAGRHPTSSKRHWRPASRRSCSRTTSRPSPTSRPA
jgi:hypothetical protein